MHIPSNSKIYHNMNWVFNIEVIQVNIKKQEPENKNVIYKYKIFNLFKFLHI